MSVDLSNHGASSAHNEFRSDTFTTPTISMFESIAQASTGDAVYNEDTKTIELEKKVAALAGKEAGLFCVSGTLSNQIGLRVNLFQPPHAVLCDFRAHVYACEAGGLASLSQAMVQTIIPANGLYLTLDDDIIPNFVPEDGEIHSAPTKVISLENTLSGTIFPLEEIKKISKFCKENDVKFHLDGARLWNASAETGVSIEEYCSYFDSVSLCLSKTIGAPIGSVLVSTRKFINKANHFKKQNGGGIRQSGFLATMASVAIDENFPKLKKTHETAQRLGKLFESKGIVLSYPVDTNMIFIDARKNKMDNSVFTGICAKLNVKANLARLVFHYQQTDESVESVVKAVLETFEYAKVRPFVGSTSNNVYKELQNETLK